jgi:hypothetical protein
VNHYEWIAIVAVALLGAIAAGVKMTCDKLDRIAETLNDIRYRLDRDGS